MRNRQIYPGRLRIKTKPSVFERVGFFVGKHATPRVIAACFLVAIAAAIWVASGSGKPSGESLHVYPDPAGVDRAVAWRDDAGTSGMEQIGGRPGTTLQIMAGDHPMTVILDPADVKMVDKVKQAIRVGVDRQVQSEREHAMRAPAMDPVDQRAAMEALVPGMGQDGR